MNQFIATLIQAVQWGT